MLTAQLLKSRPQLFARLAGVTIEEFDKLFDIFKSMWLDYIRHEFIERKGRIREYGGGHKPKLICDEDKLLFILMYFRIYPLQIVQGVWFNFHESIANRWVHRLTPILEKTLEFKCMLPKHIGSGKGGRLKGTRNNKNNDKEIEKIRNIIKDEIKHRPSHGRNLEEIIAEFPDLKNFLIDATERKIRRPKNNQKQKNCYSGKKKCHTTKNIILSDSKRGFIHLLGATQMGSLHDKIAADEENLHGKSDITIGGDLGFLGYMAGNTKIVLPKKKPKGEELTDCIKQQNQIFSRIRVKVEHAISGVKRSHIASDIFRNTKPGFNDLSMFVACGLHNYRVSERYDKQFCQI